MNSPAPIPTNSEMKNTPQEDPTKCPLCYSSLQKCLIQQNYAMIICPNVQCGYPFTTSENIDHILYVHEDEVLSVAESRLSNC
ncbi:hypothetical protein TBLA_0D00210 [Henningerozyma blattae CBS 6284]|uniref:Uncharacterized protein n=1 Tax=Henningerozyma blattae (strain ATCC 34711 / CBS 6284 / DSM 70876 / NBRC 10599 / NRRL Y-10934 / UCD 77-7) TaxID=1071380 RepID=I2H2C9_HENB6|nr:hypothetical protein TBLA_0D00210 [Tetrapisispora blattae CBS 6284]CCH60531.1 hypothetical protein TBLA_0D00210 [Tetrapisispora blattae CBS 6284]